MILFDAAYELTLGVVCGALDARGAAGSSRRGWWITGTVYVPLATVGLLGWPGWQAMYAVDVEALGRAPAVLLQLGVLAAMYAAGLACGRRVAFAPPSRLLAWGALGWLAMLLLLFVGFHARATTVATHAAFHAGARRPALFETGVPAFLGVSIAINAAAAAWMLLAARRQLLARRTAS